MADRLIIARLIASRGFGAGRRTFLSLADPIRRIGSNAPRQLTLAPPDLRTADATVASDIYGGFFSFAGKVVQTAGSSPFRVTPPNRAWAEALDGFGWLRHLRAADTVLARANARALVDDFLKVPDRARPDAWASAITARRLISWLSQSPLILDGADHAFYRRFLKAMGRHVRLLTGCLREGGVGEARLPCAIALCLAGLSADDLGPTLRAGSRVLTEELDRVILADGGHITRNPCALVDLLYDLLPLRQTYQARGLEAPPALMRALDRMMPMLKLFRHTDGSIGLFNGMGYLSADALATLFAYDDNRAPAALNAPFSGYQRIERGGCVLMVDTGPAPEPQLSARAHAGCLSFEFSTPAGRLIVNCGAPPAGAETAREAARATAAHSTLVIEDTSSARMLHAPQIESWLGAPIVEGPRDVTAQRTATESQARLSTSHDGYGQRFGAIHERVLGLSEDGATLSGVDRLIPAGPDGLADHAYALRFHLHPSVRASETEGGRGALVVLSNGDVWRFEAGGLPVTVEESVFFAAATGARRTDQIVVASHIGVTAEARWSLTQQAGERQVRGRNPASASELPL